MNGALSMNPAGAPAKKIYQDKLRKISRIGEVGFAIRHPCHLLYKLHQVIVACQHKRIDHYTGFPAGLYLSESLSHHEHVTAHGVLVKPAPGNWGHFARHY